LSVNEPSMNAQDAQDAQDIVLDIRLFAGAAEIVGNRAVQISVPIGTALATVVQALINEYPQLERLARLSRWAVGTEFIANEFEFTAATALAMIPPVSGG
jgi:molybdopterin converting factor small subunit